VSISPTFFPNRAPTFVNPVLLSLIRLRLSNSNMTTLLTATAKRLEYNSYQSSHTMLSGLTPSPNLLTTVTCNLPRRAGQFSRTLHLIRCFPRSMTFLRDFSGLQILAFYILGLSPPAIPEPYNIMH